ncbi:hypothetical protein B0A52_10181 [Exophiala mesophila]|uniref:Transcription factor IIIC subunit 5 HTH domain-containing protein n=1 Tax=Exophiala mesophila TaxID=212818 RepID=A0A438MT57_EXOME|nr:hypothetical protein B0A52_10181 [Exophiala mesophila]
MAPMTLPVSDAKVTSVEHPCVVRHDLDRAISMLGDAEDLAQCLPHDSLDPDTPLGLKFQPDDPQCRPVVSYTTHTNNVLLKLTVPKRTGRKRKRGSDEPFLDTSLSSQSSPQSHNAEYLLQSLADNPDHCQVQAIAGIQSSHIWRTMPDFVYSTKGSKFMDDLQSKVLPHDYGLLKTLSLPRTYGLTNTETFPLPIMSTQALPANYTYRQNPAVKTVADPLTGKKTLRNNQAPLRLFTHQCQHSDEHWPDKPHPRCVPLDQQPKALQQICQRLEELFEERPLWTRRALLNQFPDSFSTMLIRHAIAYVTFAIRSGPWRDTLCKLGVDPRTDRSYRKYQTVLIQLVPRHKAKDEAREDYSRTWVRSTDRESHIFTGQSNVPPDGKSWQLCDLVDPDLKTLVDIPDVYIRHECETRYFGWYANGTMAKIRVAVKAKIDALIEGEPLDHHALATFLQLPEVWESTSDLDSGYLPKQASRKELEWASAYRSLCRTVSGSVPVSGGSGKGRLSKTSSVAGMTPIDPNLEDMQSPKDYEVIGEEYGDVEDEDNAGHDQPDDET